MKVTLDMQFTNDQLCGMLLCIHQSFLYKNGGQLIFGWNGQTHPL